MLKFICPNCGNDSPIDAVYTEATYVESFAVMADGYAEYYATSVGDYGNNRVYRCNSCGWQLPVDGRKKPEELYDWLIRRPENVGKVMEEL
jgi:hypothetical protein